jgi:hypothetical protein
MAINLVERLSYLDFDLKIGVGSEKKYPVEIINSPAGEACETMIFPFDEQALVECLTVLQEESSARDFGQKLFEALLRGELRSRYDVSLVKAEQQDKGLRLKFRIGPPELAALPWELLYDPRRGEYVCLSRDTPLVRFLELPQAVEPLLVSPPLRILGMVASPGDLLPLDVAQEKQRVEKALKDLQARGLVTLTWLKEQTWRDLQQAMRGGPWQILHFIGHGGFDQKKNEGFIALTEKEGKTRRLMVNELGRLLADHHPLRLVLLNSCEGARGGDRDVFSSVAATLVRRGIPAVVAMQDEISDGAAIEFSHTFYEALADGMPVDAAVAETRKAISLVARDTVEWAAPVLFMRAPDGVILAIVDKTVANHQKQVSEPSVALMELPKGAVPLDSQFYVERHADAQLMQQLEMPRSITTIRGARQTGKSSLLVRGVEFAKKQGALVVHLNCQGLFDRYGLSDMDQCFKHWSYEVARQIRLNPSNVDSIWKEPSAPKPKMSKFVEDCILRRTQGSVVLAMDEMDVLLRAPFYEEFFSLIRSWYNEGASGDPWEKLSVVMAISTYPSLFISNINESPFNVGVTIELQDFSEAQVRDLNKRHGEPLRLVQIPEVMELLGGHPYLIRQALYTLTQESMSWRKLTTVADKKNGPFRNHLYAHLGRLYDDQELVEAMRRVVADGACPEGKVFMRLESAGLVKRQGRKCVCNYGLYELFFGSELL